MTPEQRASTPFIMDVGEPPPLAGQEQSGPMEMEPVSLQQLLPMGLGELNGNPADTQDDSFYRNLADDLEKSDPHGFSDMARELAEAFERDLQSYEKMDELLAKGIDELGFDRSRDTRTEPFVGASAVVHPMLAQAVIELASRVMPELMPPTGPAKANIPVGSQNPQRQDKAERVAKYINWQVTEQCPEYRTEYEKMLMILGFTGDATRKLYWDDDNNRPRSEFINSEQFVVPYGISDLETAPRYTHMMYFFQEQVAAYQESGLWRNVQLETPSQLIAMKSKSKAKQDSVTQQEQSQDDRDAQYQFLEMHVDWFFESLGDDQMGDMVTAPALGAEAQDMPMTAEQAPQYESMGGESGEDQPTTGTTDSAANRRLRPYIVTLERFTYRVVAVRRNWKQEDIKARKRVWFMHYILFPFTGWRGIGLWHLIGSLTKAATGALRIMLDAAALKCMPSGIRLKGSRTSSNTIRFRPLDFVEVDAPGATDIRQVAMSLPFNGPDTVMFELLGFLVNAGTQFASVALQKLAEQSTSNIPVGTALALVEEGARVFSAIHTRLHFAQRKELRLLCELNYDHLEDQVTVNAFGGELVVMREDFAGDVGICPVSDPGVSNQLQRLTRADAVLSLALKAKESAVPVNLQVAFKQSARAMGAENVNEIFPDPEQAQPLDPVSELMAIIQGKPVDAFPGQNHDAHVAFMRTISQNAQYQQMIENVAPAFIALAHKHLVMAIQDKIREMIEPKLREMQMQLQRVPPQLQQQAQEKMRQTVEALMAEAAKNLPVEDMFGSVAMMDASQDGIASLTQTAWAEIQLEKKKHEMDTKKELAIKDAELRNVREIKMWDLIVKVITTQMQVESKTTTEMIKIGEQAKTRAADLSIALRQLMVDKDNADQDREYDDYHQEKDREFEDYHREEDRKVQREANKAKAKQAAAKKKATKKK